MCSSTYARLLAAGPHLQPANVSNALTYLMAKDGHFTIAYLDDYAGCHQDHQAAMDAFNHFKELTASLGLNLAGHKCVPPTPNIEWLGYAIDTNNMSVAVPKRKLDEFIEHCQEWINRKRAHKKALQSLVGRMAYISNCVLPGRKFMSRVLTALRNMKNREWTTISQDVQLDVKWFIDYARNGNGVSFFNPERKTVHLECDSSLQGGGGNGPGLCYTWKYSAAHKQRFPNIHELEAVNLIVAVKTLAPTTAIPGSNVIVWTDNISSAYALETGRTHDATLSACARELWLLGAKLNLTFSVAHVRGERIPLADALSRLHSDPDKERLARAIIKTRNLTLVSPAIENYVFFSPLL